MATTIQVRRKSAISWVLIPDGVASNDVQEAYWRGTRFGNLINFKSFNGAVEFKDINYQNISYVDELNPANNIASFSSGYECYNYLKEQGFFDVSVNGGGGVDTFLELLDTPSSYLGQALKLLRVNNSSSAIEFYEKIIASTFLELLDTPNSYDNGKFIRSTASGLEWSDGFNVNQNNRGVVRNYGVSNSMPTKSIMASTMNLVTTVISEIQTPFIATLGYVEGSEIIVYPFIFIPGKGTFGVGGTTVATQMLFQLYPLALNPTDVDGDPNAVIINIDPVTDGDFISKANESFWDFSDSQYQTGEKSYYFSYTDSGVLYYALFVGTPGLYGTGGADFVEDDFITTSNETPPIPAPEVKQAWVTDQLVGGYLQNDSLKNVAIDCITSDGVSILGSKIIESNPSYIHNTVTGEVSGIDSFPDSLIMFYFSKIS